MTLQPPGGTAPPLTPSPTFDGPAGTAPGDSQSVDVLVYPGPDTSPPAARILSTSRAADGSFSVQVTPSLGDGQYTAVAIQHGVAGDGSSAPQTFRIKAAAPAVGLDQPAAGASTPAPEPTFSGPAGHGLGDSAQVKLTLYVGDSTAGDVFDSATFARSGATWAGRCPAPLPAGVYTAQASQTDDVGHTGMSIPHSFIVVRPAGAVGRNVTLSRSGKVSVQFTCAVPAGHRCTGTLLILTLRSFHPAPGAPTGRLRMLFAYLDLAGGQTVTLTRHLSAATARALRRARRVKLRADTSLSARGPTASASTIRALTHS